MESSDKLKKREGITMNDGEALLRGVDERINKLDHYSDIDIKVPDVNAPNIRNHDVVAELFGVSLKSYKDINDFTKGIKLGKYPLWSELTREKRKEVLYTIGDIWDALVEENVWCLSLQSAARGSKTEPSKPKANFRSLCLENLCDGAKFSIPRKVVETVSTRFDNTLYGYFIGKRIAFPVVEYYARNNWRKPWMIRNSPIILKKWSMDTRLCKDDLTRIPVWVKIHDVHIQVYSEDGLSIVASQIGKPIMLDFYTTSMCIESWGRSSFARCLIEINAEDVLQESLTMGVPLIEGTRFTIETVTIEYEWKPPRCDLCKIFGHVQDHCPKKVSITPSVVTSNVATPTVEKANDGFQTVGKKKKKKGKSKSTNGGQFDGHPVKQTVRYEPKATTSAPNKGTTNVGSASKSSTILKTTVTSTMNDNIPVSNPYSTLDEESEEEVENMYDESTNLHQSKKTGGSSSTFTVAAG
ncbi:zinc knuckle CX2CX4HX4C containing protein [Tanacetum coccineum]